MTPPSISSTQDAPPAVPRVEPVTTVLRVLAALSAIGAVLGAIGFATGVAGDDADGAVASLALGLAAMTSAALMYAVALGLDLLNGILWNTGEVAAAVPDEAPTPAS